MALAGSEPRMELKSSSGYGNDKGSEDESLSIREDKSEDDLDKVRRGVPVDEMLSDDYYEQDEDEHPSDLLHQGAVNRTSGINLNPKSGCFAANKYQSKKSKASNHDEFGNAEADYEDDEDDGDEDNPDDADFDPDFTTERRNQDEDWAGEDIDEDVNIDDDLDISDEDDDFHKKHRGRQRGKSGLSLKQGIVIKSHTSSNQQKRGRMSLEDVESSAKDSDNDSEEEFSTRVRRGAHSMKKNVARATSTYMSSRGREVRTSNQSVRKVSYAESEESEDHDESKRNRGLKGCLCH